MASFASDEDLNEGEIIAAAAAAASVFRDCLEDLRELLANDPRPNAVDARKNIGWLLDRTEALQKYLRSGLALVRAAGPTALGSA